MSKGALCVVIPAYNEEQTVGFVVAQVKKIPAVREVIVVDDGSTDRTGRVAKKAGATVLYHLQNKGTGSAVATGLRYAHEKGYRCVCLVDADGQHDPAEIPQLLAAMGNDVDLVIGSRYMKDLYRGSFVRRWGTWCVAFLVSLRYGMWIHDPTSGFRVFGKKALRRFANAYPVVFSEPETILEVLKQRMYLKEVPVTMRPRRFGTSSITPSRALYLMAFIIRRILEL